MIDLLAAIDSLSETLETQYPEVSRTLDEAGMLLVASDERISADVDDFAGALRKFLPNIDYDESVQVATDLIQRYKVSGDGERDALNPIGLRVLMPQLPHTPFKAGPDPASSGLYTPGKPDWWNV